MDPVTLGILGTLRIAFVLGLMAGAIYVAHFKKAVLPGTIMMGFALLAVFVWPATNLGDMSGGAVLFALVTRLGLFFSLIGLAYVVAYRRNDMLSAGLCLVGAFIAFFL